MPTLKPGCACTHATWGEKQPCHLYYFVSRSKGIVNDVTVTLCDGSVSVLAGELPIPPQQHIPQPQPSVATALPSWQHPGTELQHPGGSGGPGNVTPGSTQHGPAHGAPQEQKGRSKEHQPHEDVEIMSSDSSSSSSSDE